MATRKEIAQNQKILYDDAVANNMFQAAVPTFKEFQKRLEGQGYQKMVFDNYKKHNVKGKGFNNLNEFRGAFGGSFYADENKIGVSNRTAAILSSANNAVRQAKRNIQSKLGQAKKFDGGRVTPYLKNPLQNQNVQKNEFNYNSTTGKTRTYTTTDGVEFDNEYDATQYQNQLDKQGQQYINAVNAGEIPSAFDVRDKNGNYDLQENIGKNGTYLTEEGAQKQFDKKLADAYARKKEIEAAIAEDHRLHGNPLLSYGASIGASNGRTAEQSDYSNKLATSLALVKEQIGALEAVKQYPTSSWGEDALKALDNTAFTAKTWDFGLTDFATMGQMERIKTKMDNKIPLSGSDKMLLKSKLGADAAAALEDEKMGNIYRWTKIAGQSLPFMLDFFMTGGYGGITKGISRGALKFAAKRGMGKLGAAILKNTGVVGADIIGSYAMAGTEQAFKTGADIMQRHMGNLYQDEKGDYKFGTFDENGNLLHEGGESMGTALYKGLTSAMVENYTEKLFGHNYGIKKGAVNFMEKHGMNASAEFFKNIGKSGWYTNSKKWMEKVGINGFAEEVMEEEIGIPLHALLDGEGKVSDLLDTKQQLDIIGGMAISVGSMYAMGAGAKPVKGIYNRAQYYRFRNKVNVADSDAENLMGDNWADIKDKIDNATNEQMGSVLAGILRQRDTMTKEQINAAVNYGVNLMKMRGYNIAKTAEMNAREITNEPTTPEEQHQTDIDNAYSEGHDADDADKHDMQIQHEDQMKTLAAALGISEQQLSAMSDEELESLTGQDDKLDQAIYDYQLSSARYQGVVDDAQDKVDLAAHQAEQRVDLYTDQSRGSVRNATIKASGGLEDYGVYIISGNVATHDDGSIDVSNSDDMILYYDPTTNSVEHADATMFAELGEELPADDVKSQAVADAKENAIKEVAGIIDGTVEVGSQFNVTDTDGTEHTYEVLADYGDGTAAISIDGNVVENPYSLADLQQMKDLEDQKRLEAAKAEREQMESERAAQQNQETEETQPSFDFNQILNDNGNVVLVDVLDKDGNTKYPDSRLFLIRDAGAKAKVVELKSDGTIVPHAVNKEDVATISSMSLDEYKQAMPESSMIEDNSGEESDEDSQLANLGLPKGSEIWMSGDGFGRPKENTLSRVVGIDEQGSIILEDKDGKKWSASFDYINNHRELPPLDENTNIVNGENNQTESNAEENTPAPEQTPAITLEDGTEVPMLEDGNPDFSKLTAAQTAELYDTQFGEDADSVISGWVSDAKKALDKASNMTVKGKTFVEQKASKDAKEKAIADAQAAYDSAIAIRDAYNERQLAKVEDTAEGRKELIEKARRKFARLKSAVKDDAEAVSQLYRDTIGSLLHRLYDGTGIDVTDTIPLTAEEYVASNLGAHSLNYEGTETSKGVKQETGLSREDFAKTQLLAANGKGTTIDALVHSLWENRPSNLESLDTQDIRAALLDIINSGFKASEARNFVENIRIAQAENILEEQKKAADNAAYAEQQKAEQEAEQKAKSDEKAESEAKSGAKLDNESSNESNDLSNETDNEKINDKINDNINSLTPEQQKAKEEGEKLGFPAVDKEGEPINQYVIELANWAKEQGLEIEPSSEWTNYADLFVMCKDGFGVGTLVPDRGEPINQVVYFPDNVKDFDQLWKLHEEFNVGRDLKHSADMDNEQTQGAMFYDGDTAREFKDFVDKKVEEQNKVLGEQLDESDLPFSAKENGKQQTTAERAADVEKNKVDDMKVVDNIVGQKTRKAFERLAKMMGASIQWQYSDKLGNGWIQETKDADGNVHRTIFITIDSSITEGAQFIFGHEMTHQIKNLNPAAYNELTQLVLDTYGSDAFDKAVDETMKRYSDAGFSGRARYYYAEEVVADAVGEMIRDLNLAHTLAMKMSHPLLAAIHEILQKIKLAFFGTEYSDVTKNIIRSIEQAYVKTAKGEIANSETGEDVSYSLRQKPEPKKKGIGYKVFVLKDGKLYPPMVANPNGAETPVGVWLDADAAPIAGESKTGRPQVKQGGKGTQGGSGKLAYRPGWHLGVVPYAIQFNRKDADGNKTLFPKNFVFAEVEYAADVDYQEEARQEGINPSGKYQHSLAGLKHLPTDGYYMYRTNPNPETDPWVITGAMKVNRILTRAEQADLVSKAGREPQQIQEGDIVTDDVVNSINHEIANAPKFSLKVYHGSGADFTEFDFDHMGEGAGSQVFGWGGYVTSSKKIGKSYATLMDNDPSKAYYRIQRSNGTRFAKKYPTLESFLHGDKQIAMNDKFTEQEKIDYYNEMKKLAEPYHNLYEVDIPEDNGSNYLDWDKSLSKEQKDAIREGLEHIGVDIKKLESKGQSLERTGENIYNSTLYIGLTGTEYDLPERTKGISKFLSSVGFAGIKYKAGRNFGGAKKGDTNYVIFKPEDMRITEHTKFSIKTYHGSQASFDKFDHSFMGSGEGAQAYGWGTYVSEVEGIAKAYAKANTAKRNTEYTVAKRAYEDAETEYKNLTNYIADSELNINMYNIPSLENNKKKLAMYKEKGIQHWVEVYEQRVERGEKSIKEERERIEEYKVKQKEAYRLMEEAKKKLDSLEKPKRNLYSVEIPDDTGKNYLDWDGRLPKTYINRVNKALEASGHKTIDTLYPSRVDGKLVGQDLYDRLRSELGSQKAASLLLKDSGFYGVKVIAQRNTGGNKEDKMNYVIFDENNAQITSHTKFSLKDGEYLKAVEDGDMEKAQNMVNEAAKAAGYSTGSSYQGTSAFNGVAPCGNGYFLTKEERKEAWDNGEFEGESTLGDYINDDIDGGNLEELTNAASYRAADPMRKEAIDNVRNAIQKKAKTITMYRSVPSDVKEGSFRNGDWVTPSRAYAIDNAKLHGWGDDYNIIEQKVPVDDVWFDGNDIAEWGYGREEDYINDTDFAYKNSKNNKKLLDAVTYDDNGNVIPLSQRFNEKNKDVRFSLKDEKTLVGVHNISEEKLLKAIKQGGLANPSVAVIDSSKQDHKAYGGISLIMPSDKIAKRTGKNAGTWQGDAYTPTYPQVERQMSNKGAEKASKDVSSVPSDMYSEVRRGLDRWLDGGEANSAMAYMFLHEKGVAPEPKKIQPKFSDEVYNELKFITAGDFNIYGIGKADAQKVLDMYIDNVFGGDRAAYDEKQKYRIARYKKQVAEGEKNPFLLVRAKDALEQYDKYGFYFDKVQNFVRNVERDHRMTGVDTNATLNDVEDYIKTNNLTDEFNTWLEGKEKEYGVKEVIFDGFTPSGNRRYVPNTLENVSKLMKKQGRNGATGAAVSFQNFAARLMPSYGTLKDIRSKKGLLTSDREKFDKFRDKWSSVFFELGNKCQPDSTSAFDSYGMERLSEAAMTSDPQAYLKKEYNVDFSDEDTKRLKEMVKAIKEEHPAMYFETKFERPVRFDEFSAAVVPTTTKKEVKDALKNAGVSIFEYDEKSDADRSRAFNEALNSSDNIRFSLAGERGAADMAEDLKSLNTPEEVDYAIKTAIEDMPSGWKMANKKMIHVSHALGENRKAEIAGEEPKFSLKDGSLIKAGTYFSGGGLVEEGLKGIIDPVVAVEYDEKISGVYRNNFGQHIVTADVRDVDPRELVKQIDGEVEYFHASPVCKNYSQAKSNHAEVELDKETAASTADFINAVKPKVVTIENVKGYKDSDAMKTITDALDANGYTWDADVYNAADYGGYTNRERLIVRAVRDGKLPAKPKKIAHKSGWYEAVADIIPTLTEKKNGVAPWMDVRLKADGIDWRDIDKPLYVMGSAYADGKVPHAFADELLPTLRTKSGDVIVMPDGKVYRAMGRVLARVSGVSDDYKMPSSENLSHTIIGNGIPTQLTEHVIAPLLTGSDPKFSIRTYHGTGVSFDKFDLSHAFEGEGSETFGHGVYVTNSKKIGDNYAQRAKDRKGKFGFEYKIDMSAEAGQMLSHYINKNQDVDKGLENARQDLKSALEMFPDDETLKELSAILQKDNNEIAESSNEAYRYDVDIPDDNGENYLGWNESQNFPLEKWYRLWEITHHGFSDNEYFKDGGARYDKDRIERIIQMKLDSPENGMQNLPTLKGEELYHALEDFFDRERPLRGAKLASRALSEIGFVGIKYPAGMIHGGAEEGDYNYVIFDENNANIVGNTKFSLRYDQFEHDLNQWKKDNNLPKDAQRPTIPQRNAGESAVDFLKRVDEYRKQMALWKTAPTYEQHLLSDDTALGEFNRELQRGSVLKRIAFQDSMLAIRKAQEAIMKEVGVDRLNMAEDAYTAENRSHGKGKNEFEEYNNEFLQPLRKAYHQMKKILGDSYDNVRIYMMAKHGLERDAQMAFKKSLDADFEDVAKRSAAYRAYKGDMNRIINDSDLEFGRIDFKTWRNRDNLLRTKYSPSYMAYRYDDNGIVFDYSGLSALFGGPDFEEAGHKLVRDIESKHVAEVQDLWNATNAATKKILRDGYKAGMMNKDTYQYVRDMYGHYIPLRGWDGTTADQVWDYIGGGKGAFNQTLKTAHGRTSIADDPIAYIENMAESGILLNNKNWVKQHLMLFAQNHPTSLLTLSKAWYVKSVDDNGNEEWIPATPQITSQMNSNQVKAAIDAFEKKMENMAQTGDATQKRDGLNIAYPQTHSEEREHEVRVMKDGEEYVIYVNGDPQLAQAMNNTRAHRVREIQSGKLDRAAAWLGRKMAAAYTSLSPLFIPSNYFRDLTMTLASTAIREDAKYNYLLRKNLATSWNLGFMLRDYQNGKLREKVSNGNATAKEKMFYDFMMNGGETGFVSSLDVEDLKKKFKNDLKDLDRWKANPVKVGHTIMDGIEFLNRAIEDSNRFAVYMTSIQYGRSIDEAVNDAKDVTLNFNRKGTGEYGWQMVRNLYLFINPAVQSLQTLGALAKHHPFKFTAVTASWLASGVLVPIVNAALMSMLGGDDDKDKYWQFTKWDRRNNLIMWVPFTHEYVKIPLAQEFRAFYGIGDMIASKMMGGELAEESWSQYAEDMLGQVVDMLPLDPTGYDGNIAVSLMPNAIRPVFELAFNVDFTGKPLFKDSEYNKYDPNFTKAYVGTPDWLVRASKMVNSIGNDYPDVQQNSIDAFGDPRYNLNNPAVVDHVLSSYLGGAYTMGSQVLGVLTKALNDPKEIKVADIPLFSKFVSNPDDRPVSKKQGDEFWNMKENHDRAANTLSKLKKQAKVDGDYSMLERFYGSEEYKQYKQDDVKVKKYEEDKKKERAEESGEEYRLHKLNAEDIYKAHATPKDDFEDLKLKQLFTKLNGFKTSYDLLLDTAPSQSDGYYNTNKAAIDAIEEISPDKQEISELKKGFLDDGKDAYNADDMKRIRELRKNILSVLEKANKVVVANQKSKTEK